MGEVLRMDRNRSSEPANAPAVEPLWREVVGRRLREMRQSNGDTLSAAAQRAGISPQYLSEVERGHKDPSSEILAAVAGALGTSVGEIAGLAHSDLTRGVESRGATLMAA